jgi:hypothetical protein
LPAKLAAGGIAVRIQSVRQGTRRGLARIAQDRCRRDDRRTRFEGSGLKWLIAVAFNSASRFPSSGKVLPSKRFVGPGMTAPRLPDPDCLFALSGVSRRRDATNESGDELRRELRS